MKRGIGVREYTRHVGPFMETVELKPSEEDGRALLIPVVLPISEITNRLVIFTYITYKTMPFFLKRLV